MIDKLYFGPIIQLREELGVFSSEQKKKKDENVFLRLHWQKFKSEVRSIH